MSNHETFEPMGLVDLSKEFTKLKANRKRLDDLTDRLEIAMDAKALQLKPTPRDQWEREVKEAEVAEMEADMDAKRNEAKSIVLDKPDYAKQLAASLETGAKYFHSVFEAGREAGHEKGYDEGFKAGLDQATTSEQRDRELLEEHGIDVDGFVARTAKMIEDRDDDDIDEDEPDQYPPNYGGTK